MNKGNLSTEKHINEKQQINVINKENILINTKKRIKIVFIILVIFNIIFIFTIGFLLYYFLKMKGNSNKNSTEISESLEKKSNSIEATYKIKEGQPFFIFNPNELNLKEGDYSLDGTIESQNNKTLRHLREIEVENGIYSPRETGYLSIKIIFKYNLKSLNCCFKNCKELIKVNLTNLEMEEVRSMDSTFSGCSKLNEINLEGINTANLMDMSYTFENCSELRDINLSPIKASKATKIESIFSGCEKLEVINISSFENLNDKLFNGIKSKPNIIGNTYISTKITQIFYNLFNVNINVTIIKINNKTNEIDQCNIGEKEKCKKCSQTIPENCLICNDGYYLPFNEYENKVCLPCNKIEHCVSCYGDKKFITCSSCEEEYSLENNICIKQKNLCIIGENEKCKTCNDNPNLRNQCKECNEGYYLPLENRNSCESCEKIENCKECALEVDILFCHKCKDGFILINNECVEEMCVIGESEKCASCRNEKGRKKECSLCNYGFYISDNNPYICKKCSIKNCKKCSFKNGNEICLECFDTYVKIKNDEGYINSCTCPYGNITSDGLCINNGNWIEIIAKNQGELIDIINFYYIGISVDDIDLYINDKLTPFNFENKKIKIRYGNYENFNVKLNIKKKLTSMEGLFDWCHSVKSVTFLPGFDSTQVTSMRRMFYDAEEIEIIDMKNLEFDNLIDLGECFNAIPYNFRIWDKVPNSSLIDFSSIDTSKVTNCLGIFHIIYDTYTIKISNKFTTCKEFIPINNRVINIDDLACNKIDNCKKCGGSVETLHCIQCNVGFQLIDNKCLKPKCILGENEKCYICNNISNYENECMECNDGYYLPSNFRNKTQCIKCPINGCKRCDDKGICQGCKIDFEPTTKDGIIVSCTSKCDLGENDKCLTCDSKKGNKKCSSCNPGFKLMKNGSCKKIENSFIAKYNVNTINEPIRIMDIDSANIELSDFDMYLNGTKVFPIQKMFWYPIEGQYVAYTFNKTGIHEIKIIFKKTLTLMLKLFQRCSELISISFNESFDTSHVLSMQQLFYECLSLEFVNVSSFNTSLAGDYYGIFFGCPKLTSLDLSNFKGTYAFSPNGMFYESNNLKYIDLSSFTISSQMWCYLGLGDSKNNNGTIIINKNFSFCYIEEGWNVIYKD